MLWAEKAAIRRAPSLTARMRSSALPSLLCHCYCRYLAVCPAPCTW
jgi:hypothetical protein